MEHHLTTYITHDTLISALGFGTQENLEAIRSYHSGITLQTDKRIADTPLLAATLSQERLQQQAEAIGVSGYPRMEQLFSLTDDFFAAHFSLHCRILCPSPMLS